MQGNCKVLYWHVFSVGRRLSCSFQLIIEGCPRSAQRSQFHNFEPALVCLQEDGSSAADLTITDRVYFEVMECPSLARADRTLGNTSLICSDGENLGRIVIGLYGKQVCYFSCLVVEYFLALRCYFSTPDRRLLQYYGADITYSGHLQFPRLSNQSTLKV